MERRCKRQDDEDEQDDRVKFSYSRYGAFRGEPFHGNAGVDSKQRARDRSTFGESSLVDPS